MASEAMPAAGEWLDSPLVAILDAVQLGLAVLDLDGRVVLFNRWMAQRSGFSAQQAIGRSLVDLFPEIAGTRVAAAMRSCGDNGLPSLLSNSLHPTPFPLYADAQRRAAGVRVQQTIRVQALPATSTGTRLILVEVGDVSAAVRREQVLSAQAAQLRALSTMDSLTGLPNRRGLDETLARAHQGAMRSRLPVALLMVDIDLFKQYNDTYGHQAGDKCLVQVAGCLRDSVARPSDMAARYGGEEFLLILPDTGLDGAMYVANKARDALQRLQIPHAGNDRQGVVTISVGVAVSEPGALLNMDALVAGADIALYRAKQDGRNRIHVAAQRAQATGSDAAER